MAALTMRTAAQQRWVLGIARRRDLRGIGDGGTVRRCGRLLQQEGIAQVVRLAAARGVPQAIVADLMEAGRQNVLQKAADELVAGHGFAAAAAGRPVGVAEAHARVGDAENAIVGDGDAEGIAGEIIERGLLACAPRRDVNYPRDVPDMVWQSDLRA